MTSGKARALVMAVIRSGDARRILKPLGWTQGAESLNMRMDILCEERHEQRHTWATHLARMALVARGLNDAHAPNGWKQLGVVVVAVECIIGHVATKKHSMVTIHGIYTMIDAVIRYRRMWRRRQ